MDPARTQALGFACDGLTLALEGRPAHIVDQAHSSTGFAQARIGVVFTQLQPVLGPAGEHPVGLGDPLRDQVVDQHAQISLVAKWQPTGLAFDLQGSIHASKQALRGRLFVARGAVDLAGKEKAVDRLRLERRAQAARVEEVVLDRIAGTQDVRLLQPLHRMQRGQLHVEWQRGGNAVRINLVRRQTLGLQKNLVARLVGKSVHLVLDARAVARAAAFDQAGEHRAAVEAAANDLVGAFVGVGDPARQLARVHCRVAEEAEHRHLAQRRGSVR